MTYAPTRNTGGDAITGPTWEIGLEMPDRAVLDVFEALMEEFCSAIASFEVAGTSRWRLTGYTDREPDRAALRHALAEAAAKAGVEAPQAAIASLADTDWVARVESELKPIRVGPYFVHGSHVTEPPPAGMIPVRIDAGLAFGTGSHETTRGCLTALERLWPGETGPRNPLDVGTGSGILAIALARRYGGTATATDIDSVAVEVARQNAAVNGVADRIVFAVCAGLDDDLVRRYAPYDLIFANIVANPLIEIAVDVAGALSADGRAVLSGILSGQQAAVSAAYAAAGLALLDRVPLGDWATLVVGRS